MIATLDPTHLRNFPTLPACGYLNETLDKIRFTGRCIHLGWIIAHHPTGRKRAGARIDPGIAFSLRGYAPPFEDEKLKAIARKRIRFRQTVSRAVRDALNHVYSEGYRPKPLINGETVWDWAVSETIEDLIAEHLPNAMDVCVSCPFLNSTGVKSALLYAVFDSSIRGNLPDVMRSGTVSHGGGFEELCAHNHTSFQQAVIFLWLNEVTRSCLSEMHFQANLRADNAVPTNFLRDVATLLMTDHVEDVSSWAYTLRSQGGMTRGAAYVRLFDWCTLLSHQRHEGQPLLGSICISNGRDVRSQFELTRPVKTKNARALGKLIIASTTGCYPIIRFDETKAYGCYSVDSTNASEKDRHGAIIEFRGSGAFRWFYRGQTVMDVINGTPFVYSGIPEAAFAEHFKLRFDSESYHNAWEIIQRVSAATHGAMVIISAEAEAEASRIRDGFATVPIPASDVSFEKLASIDGGLLIDPDGKLFAFGFFLDGVAAVGVGDIGRGARFNSAQKYVHSFYGARQSTKGLLIAVVSQDGMVDLVPDSLGKDPGHSE